MNRKHFILFAEAIRFLPFTVEQKRQVIRALVPVFKQGNPNFDADRFESAVFK